MELSKVDNHLIPRLRRREFLTIGAGAMLLPSISWAGLETCDGLALGYCRDALSDAEGLATSVVPADRLGAGDPELARHGARVTIHGLVGDAERLGQMGIRALDLQVRYKIPGTDADGVDFRAWSYQLLPVEQNGAANSFRVPVDDGLRLVLEIETLSTERYETVLVTGRESGQLKLRTGDYLIAPASSGEFRARRFDPAQPEPFIALSVERDG